MYVCLWGPGHLANNFGKSYGDEEEDETDLHLMFICLALGRRRNRHLVAYYMKELDEQTCTDIGSLNRFIERSVCGLSVSAHEVSHRGPSYFYLTTYHAIWAFYVVDALYIFHRSM